VWRELAKAGHDLFRFLFFGGDARLKRLGEKLATVLREHEQTITVSSNSIVAPWWLMYVPRPGTALRGAFDVERTAFWGYQHLVEHNFESKMEPEVHIRYNGRPLVGAYVDHRLDKPHQRPVVAPIVQLMSRRAAVTELHRLDELDEDMRDGAGRSRHLLYFCCHCDTAPDGRSMLRLGDDQPITPNEFRTWFTYGRLDAAPLVFINACNAAQNRSDSMNQFSRVILEHGATALLGPYISVPVSFARAFAAALLHRVLAPQVSIGESMQALTRYFADRFRNPLGLSFALYQGIDGHFCQRSNE
jgi:hypothetical protein